MEPYKILSPSGIVGYGFPESSFLAGVAQKPDLIACDGGSTDPGPYYLGSGKPFTTASAVKRDLRLMVKAACELGIPLVIGTAGGSGGTPHLERERKILLEIAAEEKLSFKLATVSSQLDQTFLVQQLHDGKILPLGPAPVPTEEDLLGCSRVVAQMGIEPIISALDQGAQVVLCGRCYDPAAFAAPAIRAGYSEALATHLGKILECACIAATPGSGSDCMMGYLYPDSFAVEPCSPDRKCTTTSVAAHTLYEKSNPYLLPGPGGTLDLRGCTFHQETERRVRVYGSQFIPQERKNVKLEGAKLTGCRTISICGNRDPLFIGQLQSTLEGLKKRVADNLNGTGISYQLDFIVYGQNGVMGALEPDPRITSHEVGIVIDALSDTQEHANTVCSVARSTMLHYGYPGRMATAGNLAFPFSPSDIAVGDVYVFGVYALLEHEDPAALFPRTFYEIVNGEVAE